VKYTQKQTTSELDEMLFYGLCAGAAVLFLAIVAICCKCRKQKKITTSASQDLGYPSVSGNNSNERSLHIESMGDDETEGNRDQKDADSSKGQAMMQKGTFV